MARPSKNDSLSSRKASGARFGALILFLFAFATILLAAFLVSKTNILQMWKEVVAGLMMVWLLIATTAGAIIGYTFTD